MEEKKRMCNQEVEREEFSSPELSLVAAVLCRAVRDYQICYNLFNFCDSEEYVQDVMHKKFEIREYVKSNNYLPYSFNWCCEMLDVEPSYLRAVMLLKPITIFKERL